MSVKLFPKHLKAQYEVFTELTILWYCLFNPKGNGKRRFQLSLLKAIHSNEVFNKAFKKPSNDEKYNELRLTAALPCFSSRTACE